MYFSGRNQILKQSVLTKRSQGKSRLSAANYKTRLFVLTPEEISYHEGTEEVCITVFDCF